MYNIVLLSPIPQIYKEYKNFKRLFGKIALGTSTLSWLINDTIGWFLLKLFNEGVHSAIESMKFLYVDGYLRLKMDKTILEL